MTIGFDLDDVLLDFTNELHSYCNRYYNTNYERAHFKQNLAEMWDCSKEEEIKRVFDFYQSLDHWNALPINGAVEGIKNLRQWYNLFVVTAKPEGLKEKTLEWLDQHFSQMFDGVHFTNQYHGDGPKRTKGEVCKELGIEFFVDDSLENANDVANLEIPVLLFNAPWNQAEVQPPITRVHSWEEIVRILSHNE